MKLSSLVMLSTLVSAMALSGHAMAQDYPSQPIKIVTPFAAGGGADIAARIIADGIAADLGVEVLVEPTPGAGGQLAVNAVKAAPANGYTLLLGGHTNFVLSPIYDPTTAAIVDEFSIVNFGTDYGTPVIFVGAESGIKTLQELVDKIRGGEKVSWVSVGSTVPTPNDLAAQFFVKAAGGTALAVTYQGPTQAAPDVITGRVTFFVNPIGPFLGMTIDGTLVPLAVLSDERVPSLPDVPTAAEAGLPEAVPVKWNSWNALFARVGTPEDVLEKLNAAVRKTMTDVTYVQRIEAAGQGIVGDFSAADARDYLAEQQAAWSQIKGTLEAN